MPRRRQRGKSKPTVQKVQNEVTNLKRRLSKEPLIAVQAEVSGTLVECGTPHTAVHVTPNVGAVTNGVTLEGTSATIKSFRIKGWFASVGTTNTGGRLDVILDRRPIRGTIAESGDVYAPEPVAGNTINSMMHPEGKSRFKLLASFRATSVTNENQRYYFERYIKMNHVISTNDPGDYTQAHQDKNAIIIFKWGDTAANLMTYSYITQTVVFDNN